MPANPRTRTQLLCRCLAGALGQPLAPSDLPANAGDWQTTLRMSSAHLVTPLLPWALREPGLWSDLPTDVAEYLEAVYTLNLDRNQQCENQLAHLIPRLNGIGVRPLLLKGAAALVGGLYPTSGERMISDLDILIPVAHLPEILAKLAEVGYQPRTSVGMAMPDPVGFDIDHHYPPVFSPQWPVFVELHVHPVHLPLSKLLPRDEMFRDAIPLSWRGGDCLLPAPSHFVLHHLIHGFLHDVKFQLQRVSLRRLFEFVLASRSYAQRVDWGAIERRLDAVDRGRALHEYLALASLCFDHAPPPGIQVDDRDRLQARQYLARLDSHRPARELAIRFLYQAKRLRNLRYNPRKLRMLLTADFYSRLFGSLKG